MKKLIIHKYHNNMVIHVGEDEQWCINYFPSERMKETVESLIEGAVSDILQRLELTKSEVKEGSVSNLRSSLTGFAERAILEFEEGNNNA
jgi:hypothetical protein